MTLLYDLFSLVCHQDVSRSYTIAGLVLPFCQRCTGLYLGLATGMVAQWISGSYRRGLPSGVVLVTVILSLMIMPVFGFHWLDPGPAWRLWSGLIYGNAIAYLLVPAAWTLISPARHRTALGQGQDVVFWVQFTLINGLPLWFPVYSQAFAWAVLSMACVGALGALLCLATCSVVFLQGLVHHVWIKGDLHGSTPS